MTFNVTSNYKGSKNTYDLIRKQIKERYGSKELERYDPYSNCLTFNQWMKAGYKVKKGEHAFKSKTLIEDKDKDGNVKRKYFKNVNLFYYLQVEPVSNK